MNYDRVAFIGLGLIASSMFWAMRRAGMGAHVTGYARPAHRPEHQIGRAHV